MIRKGLYAAYNERDYECYETENGGVKLISYDKGDVANGFIPYNDTTFTKEVPRDAVEEVFFIAPYATYQNETFGVSDASNHRVLLTTSEKEKADKYHFQRTDKYLYEKHVLREEVKLMEKKTPYS
ncbi:MULTISPECIES: hypothetical protein [Priestia]|uniref:hypothetical protein n=1 Tax=Priestia TaxID=2800373 RepID=UPI000C9CACFE|nr:MULTISPECIES: hypothetical protein [Priestia]MBX9994711.1 hypothetical protein [Priestia aryabhattai]MCP1452041.1 hypothetical protein [Priestia megaterium]MCU7738688.1 hypothetical protein [Priestia megaterium]MED4051278.1 hypothetical protein [Priestia megaterium]MED4062658.1 hypothetical protein [Priestia megaterium]